MNPSLQSKKLTIVLVREHFRPFETLFRKLKRQKFLKFILIPCFLIASGLINQGYNADFGQGPYKHVRLLRNP